VRAFGVITRKENSMNIREAVTEKLKSEQDIVIAILEVLDEEAHRQGFMEAAAFLEAQISELRPPKPPEVRLAEIIDKATVNLSGKFDNARILLSPEIFTEIKKLTREILEREKGKSQ
jgi:ADP-glucose pyrophosphorylase